MAAVTDFFSWAADAVSDVFKDITAEGDEWDPSYVAPLPTEEELLTSLARAPAEFVTPKFVVDSVVREDSDELEEDSALLEEEGPASSMCADARRRRLSLICNERFRREVWGWKNRRPYDEYLLGPKPQRIVVRGDGQQESNTAFHARPAQGMCLVPVHEVKDLQRTGVLLTEERLQDLHPHLPLSCRFASRWKLIYCPSVHGVSLKAFFRQSQRWPGETLLLVKDHCGVVFGGFASHSWRPSAQDLHFGSPDCFVFSFGLPEECQEDSEPAIFQWSGKDTYFMYADSTGFGMGGGEGYAFWMNEDLLWGSSVPTKTFSNKAPLASQKDFVVAAFECWSFDRSSESQHHLLGSTDGMSSSDPWSPSGGRRTELREEAFRLTAFG